MEQRHVRWIAKAVALLLGINQGRAGTVTWDGGVDGTGTNWIEAVNWSGDALPAAADAARFSATGLALNKVIVLGASQTVDRLVFDGYDKAFAIGSAEDVASGYTLTLNNLYRQSNVGGVQTLTTDIVLATNSVWDIAAGYNSGVTVLRAIRGDGRTLEKNNNGTLTLSGTNTYSGATVVKMGTLELSFIPGTAPAADILNSAASLAVGGGAVKLSGKSSALNSQTVNGLAVNPGASSFSIVDANSGNKTRLSLGGMARTTGGTVNFSQPTVNTTVSADNGYVTTNANDASGILGAYVTVGAANWAMNDGVNIVAYNGYATLAGNTPALSDGSTVNVRISNASTGAVSLAASSVTVNSLLCNDAAPRTLSVGPGNTLRLGALGGILTPSGTGALTLDGGTLTAGGAADAAGELVFQNATTVTNAAVIADNGAGAVALTKSGAGALVLTAAATHTGGTTVNAGSLLLPGGVNPLATTGTLMVTGGTLNLGGGVQTNMTAVGFRGGVVTNGTIVRIGGGFEAQAGSVYTALGGDGGLTKTTSGTLYLAGANTYTGDTVVLEGSLVAGSGSTSTIAVRGNLIVGSPDGILPAAAGTSGGKPFNEAKNFTVYANGSLNFGGAAQYLSGTLTLIGGSFTGSQPYFQAGSAVKMTGGNLGGTIYGSGSFSITSYSNATPAYVTAGLGNTHTFSVEDGSSVFDLIYSGGHAGSGKTLTKSGAGVMVMTGARSYTGSTVVNAGTLLVNNASSSAVGNSAVAVNAGATLGGTGFIGGVANYSNANVTVAGSAAGSVTNRATVAPGTLDPVTGAHVIGTLTVGNLAAQTNNVTFGAYSALRINIATNGACDRLVVNGTLSLATASDRLELSVADAEALKPGAYPLVTFQQLAAPGQTFDTVLGLPSRGKLVYTATGISYVIDPKGTLISLQ